MTLPSFGPQSIELSKLRGKVLIAWDLHANKKAAASIFLQTIHKSILKGKVLIACGLSAQFRNSRFLTGAGIDGGFSTRLSPVSLLISILGGCGAQVKGFARDGLVCCWHDSRAGITRSKKGLAWGVSFFYVRTLLGNY
jgi:hypothetical protein